ncbi:MAG TPA: AarF/UbiB family protein [Gemmatimonadales bacterium]|nr:AarF/UbiB family protein [Gemmatimonadales bacterium]
MRALTVLVRLAPFVAAFWRDRRRWFLFGAPARRAAREHERRAERLTAAIAGLGPTFIKLAQVFAARADILPEPYLTSVSTLTDAVPPLAPGIAEQVIEQELEQPLGSIFERFETEPLAAASLGQVHRASYQGREVVVKVLRPGVDELVRRDLEVAYRILFLLHVLFRNHHVRAMSAIVGEFSKRIWMELDFREEAQNAETLRRNFASEPRIVVPSVVGELTRRRVLVLEYIEGTRIDRLHARLAAGELQLDRIVGTVIDAYIRMMLEDGFFHADPHAGNLLVDPAGRVVLLDFGMVLRVERETQARLVTTVLAAARQDVDGVINGFYELGILDPDVDRGTVRDAARQLMAVSFRDETSHRQIQQVVEDVLRTFYDWPLMLPPELVYFGRAAVLVEGLGLRYDPGFNAMAAARPIVAEAASRLLRGRDARDPKAVLTDWSLEAAVTVRTLRDLMHRVEREELRIRSHPRDMLELQRFLSQQVRRSLLAAGSLTLAMVSAIVYAASGRLGVLLIGLGTAAVLFFLVFVLPGHLFQNPLRFRSRGFYR